MLEKKMKKKKDKWRKKKFM